MELAFVREIEPSGRPVKRPRTSYDADVLDMSSSHAYGSTIINTSDMVVMGNYVQKPGQISQPVPTTAPKLGFDDLLESLRFDRIDLRVNNVRPALLSTCEWLVCHPIFLSWYGDGAMSSSANFLWIKGKPGCGKSTLMKSALGWARKQRLNDNVNQIIVPYFFNARAPASLEKSSLGFYRTVVHRILSSHSSLRPLFLEKFQYKEPKIPEDNWTAEELQGFLIDAVDSNKLDHLYLFIDALDEAAYEDDMRQMIGFLKQLSDQAHSPGNLCRLFVCLSSRHFPHISIGTGLSIVVEKQIEHGRSIELYITQQLSWHDGPDKDDLRARILDKSARIFLWVVLVVEMLNKLDDHGAQLSDMKARLDTLPADLHELFRKALNKSDEGVESSLLFFQWMLCSMRAIESNELYIAMEFSKRPNDPGWVPRIGDLNIPSPDRLERLVLSCSRGLAEVTQSEPPVVQFIHDSVREFLEKHNGLVSMIPALTTNFVGFSHDTLRTACMRYILSSNSPRANKSFCGAHYRRDDFMDTSDARPKRSFFEYAVRYLFDHAEQAQRHGIAQKHFLEGQADRNGRLPDIYRRQWNSLHIGEALTSDVTQLYFVVSREQSNLLSEILSMKRTVDIIDNTCGKYGSAIQSAAHRGNVIMVQVLLDHGANVNLHGGNYFNALHAASVADHAPVVRLLLDRGADVNLGRATYRDAIRAASERRDHGRDHTKTTHMLVEARANIDFEEGRYSDAFTLASSYGSEDVMRSLLSRATPKELTTDLYISAAKEAEFNDHHAIVVMLLKHESRHMRYKPRHEVSETPKPDSSEPP